MTRHLRTILLLAVPLLAVGGPAVAGVIGSAHDISTPGTPEVCVFCHTPHQANGAAQAPLWNRLVETKTYVMYSSATLDVPVPGTPSGESLVCLGCHDGVLTYGSVDGQALGDKHDLVNAPGPGGVPDTTSDPNCRNCHPSYYGDPPKVPIGTDLSNDHPISLTYPTPAEDPDFRMPPDATRGWWSPVAPGIRLYEGRVECGTCHDPHVTSHGAFLRVSNDGSALCLTCHVK